ncbi:MAG: glutaredoxin [Solobacterium sp.]|nr:glutaredoxin [Solobacterium sp.]
MKYYGSYNCPDCVNFKGCLDQNGIDYEFVDINRSMANLKEFLKLRDNCPVFDEAKANGSVGIPAIIDGETITLDYEGWLKEKGIEVHQENKTVCSIDSTGC